MEKEKKQVKLEVIGSFRTCEYFGNIVKDLKNAGIIAGGSHVSIGHTYDGWNFDFKNPKNLKRTFWVYSNIISPTDFCTSCEYFEKYKDAKIEFIVLEELPLVFFDWAPEKKFGCVKILINYNLFAGFYCPKYQMFYLTDWTHNRQCLALAEELLPKLFKEAKKFGFTVKKTHSKKTLLKFPKWKVVIGSDPEFEEIKSFKGYSPIPTTIEGEEDTEIGRDGAGSQIEIRPKPGTVKELIANIKKLILQINRPISVKGDRFPLGCHIHFSIPQELNNSYHVTTMCKVLDDFLGKKLIDLSGQARGTYKKLSAFELKKWGFEYRTLPSAVLLSPLIAKIIFKIAKNVLETFIRRGKISYNYPPTEEDYLKYARLTVKEFKIFENFCNDYKSQYRGDAINFNWGEKNFKQQLEVIFLEDWLEENRKVAEIILKRSRILKKLGVKKIVLYGLKKERGKVIAGFHCEKYETIPHPISPAHDLTFGLPWDVRMKSENITELKRICKAIIQHIKNKKTTKEG